MTDQFPGVQLHAANALTASFTPEEEMDRSKAVMQSSPRMPAVGFYGGRYGDRWHVDMVVLTHNAVRRQLYDAFTIANALGNLILDVPDADLSRFYAWLATLKRFVSAVFAAEDKFLYPLVDTAVKKAKTPEGNDVYLPEMLSVRGRYNAKTQVLELLTNARKTRDVATGEIPAKIHALRYALDQFGANILDYFATVDKFVPKLLKRALKNGEKEKLKMEKKLFEYFVGEPHGAMLASILMQCIESRSKRHDFLKRNIRKQKDRDEFKAFVKRAESTHMTLASTFDALASKYERKFSVNTFLQHYGANADANAMAALEMLGDMDINEEGMSGQPQNPALKDAEPRQVDPDRGEGLDDDIIEVLTEEVE